MNPELRIVCLTVASCLLLGGCNTTRGLGQDVEAAGEAIEETAEEVEDEIED